MPRYRLQSLRDTPSLTVGDRGFIGVNSRLDPSLLPDGYVSEAVNMRFNLGVAETRLGNVFLPWTNKITTGTIAITGMTNNGVTAVALTASNHGLAVNSIAVISGTTEAGYNGTHIISALTAANDFIFPITAPLGSPATGSPVLHTFSIAAWGTVYGVGIFNDPSTFQDYMIIAADGGIYYTSPNNIPIAMTLPAGVTITEPVTFTQAFDTLIVHRGAANATLQTTGIVQAFDFISQSPSGTGTQPIPNADRSLFFQNRLFVPTEDDQIAVSDFNDYTRYVPVLQNFRINQGGSDRIVTLTKFNDTTIIVFKDRSIYAITDLFGDLSGAKLDTLTTQFGLIAAESVAHCGHDLLFLSSLGVMSITQTEQNKLQSVVLPLSDPIQPLIGRINWRHANNATAAYWNNRYYLAVPLDDAEVFGPELVPSGVEYLALSYYLPTVAGMTYRYVKGANDSTLVNGTETLTNSSDFTAQGVYIQITGSAAVITASVKQVYKGVNNAVLVYDFLNRAWAGYDSAAGLMVKRFIIFPYAGRDRLFFMSNSGWMQMYEEDYEDQLTMPYADLAIAGNPSVGDRVIANGGTTATSTLNNSNDAVLPNWGTGSPVSSTIAAQNLWHDTGSRGGYYIGSAITAAGITWTSPNAQAFKITNGVRFVSANGVVPTVAKTQGSWATVSTVSTDQILGTLITRAYSSPTGSLEEFDWLIADIQTWNPKFTIDLLPEGAEEEFNQAADRTKDRTLWYKPFDKPAFNTANSDGRFREKYRRDYSVLLGPEGAATLSIHTTADGVPLNVHQQTREEFHMNQSGRSARVSITNTQGRIRVLSIQMEGVMKQTMAGVEA